MINKKKKKAPEHLGHKPIVSVPGYDQIDGKFAGHTDVHALSLGRAQYDNDELSLKVWRHTGERWSRQSEELPIHRNIDLSILFVKALIEGYNEQSFLVNPEQLLTSHPQIGSREDIMKYYEDNKKVLEPRLRELKRLLEEWL